MESKLFELFLGQGIPVIILGVILYVIWRQWMRERKEMETSLREFIKISVMREVSIDKQDLEVRTQNEKVIEKLNELTNLVKNGKE